MSLLSSARPFRVEIADSAVEELRERLRTRTRAQRPAVSGSGGDERPWQAGTDAAFLEQALEYWEKEFDWRKSEREINSLSQFMAKVGNVDLHFIHEPSDDPRAMPLLLVHGWPGSFYEFHKLIPLLKGDPNHPFHIVAPSLPGYAWSVVENNGGCNARQAAATFDKLMTGLGYSQYVVQGGDWGAVVVDLMAQDFPQRVCAMHVNMPVGGMPLQKLTIRNIYHSLVAARDLAVPCLALDAEDQQSVSNLKEYLKTGSSYLALQATRPAMIGVGLNDSPVALASWILEKFHGWTDRRGSDKIPGLSMDQMLTNISIYWFTESITTSMRFYFETIGIMPGTTNVMRARQYCAVPTGVAGFPGEIITCPKHWMALTHNLQHWQKQAWGGHFAAFENPGALHADITSFFFHVLDFDECKRQAKQRKPGDPPSDRQIPVIGIIGSALATWAAGRLVKDALSSRL